MPRENPGCRAARGGFPLMERGEPFAALCCCVGEKVPASKQIAEPENASAGTSAGLQTIIGLRTARSGCRRWDGSHMSEKGAQLRRRGATSL